VKDGQSDQNPTTIAHRAKTVGEIRGRWPWVEPRVWTERMLTALEEGVIGGKWYSLMDKVYSASNLRASFEAVQANKGGAGVDLQTIEMFEKHLDDNLADLSASLQTGTYRPAAIKRVWIPKPGSSEKRPLGIPTVRDRVVQAAIRNVIEPIFDRDFAPQSYGFRPGRGCTDALRRVNELLRAGYTFVVDADLKSYFDTIPHDRLLRLIEQKVADSRVLGLLKAYLTQQVLDTVKDWTPSEQGTPQGAVISPLLSNIYLDPLDHLMAATGIEMVRYADDFVLLCRSDSEAHHALEQVRRWTTSVGLVLHPDKTHIVDASQRGGFDFLGYHFERGHRWPRKKSLKKIKDRIRSLTKRTNGWRFAEIISSVNRSLVGWFGYFKHSYKTTFEPLDGWSRMRLRSILRKRRGGQGRGRGSDHQRWPNAFFADHGLFSLSTAYASVCQSVRR
jgi:RNA-directed DNA polymerase